MILYGNSNYYEKLKPTQLCSSCLWWNQSQFLVNFQGGSFFSILSLGHYGCASYKHDHARCGVVKVGN